MQSQTLGLDEFTALDTGRYRLADTSSPEVGKGWIQPRSPFWMTKKATHQQLLLATCVCSSRCHQQGGTLLANSFYKTSDFADGPALAATRVRTSFSAPSAVQTVSSEHPPLSLSLYEVICCSLVQPLYILHSYLSHLIMENTLLKLPVSLYN